MLYKIYVIKNYLNNKVYVGCTYKNVTARFREHLSRINDNKTHCRKLANTMKKYGKNMFYVEFLCATENENDSSVLERVFIQKYDAIQNGYNLSFGGRKGYYHCEETKKLISYSMKGKHDGTNNPFHGKIHSKETKEKISKSNIGHPGYALGKQIHTAESKQKISKANAGSNARSAILNEDQVKEIKILLRKGEKQITIANKYNVTKTIVSNIYTNRTWKHVNI